MTPELPFDDGPAVDLDALLEDLAAAVDASFLGDVTAALERAAAPGPADAPAPA